MKHLLFKAIKKKNCNLMSQKDDLDITLDNQQQYSRTVASNLFVYGDTLQLFKFLQHNHYIG